jgi:hypothetical protein
VVASLFKQLLLQRETLPTRLYDIYDEERKGNSRNDGDILELFISCSFEFTPLYVFLDALDECTTEQQHAIVDLISKLSSLEKPMKIFLTSQPQLINTVARVGPRISQQIFANTDDLKAYIHKKLENQGAEFEKDILENMTNEADGM